MNTRKWKRLLSKALESLKLELATEDKDFLSQEKDLDDLIKEQESNINEFKDRIQELEEIIEGSTSLLETLNIIKQQIEIEECRELNPKAKAIYKF